MWHQGNKIVVREFITWFTILQVIFFHLEKIKNVQNRELKLTTKDQKLLRIIILVVIMRLNIPRIKNNFLLNIMKHHLSKISKYNILLKMLTIHKKWRFKSKTEYIWISRTAFWWKNDWSKKRKREKVKTCKKWLNVRTSVGPASYIGITRSLLPNNQGKSPLPLFGSDFKGNFAWFNSTKLP